MFVDNFCWRIEVFFFLVFWEGVIVSFILLSWVSLFSDFVNCFIYFLDILWDLLELLIRIVIRGFGRCVKWCDIVMDLLCIVCGWIWFGVLIIEMILLVCNLLWCGGMMRLKCFVEIWGFWVWMVNVLLWFSCFMVIEYGMFNCFVVIKICG